MRIARVVLAALVVLVGGVGLRAARAQDLESFQTEIGFNYAAGSNGVDWTEISGSATVLQRRVETTEHPLGEAVFLERVPYVSLAFGTLDLDYGGGLLVDGPVFGFGFTFADKAMPLTASASFARHNGDLSGFDVTRTQESLSVGVGAFMQPNAVLGFSFQKTEVRIEEPGFPTVTFSYPSFGISGKIVQERADGTASNVQGSLRLIDAKSVGFPTDRNIEFSLAGDRYFDRFTSVGGSFTFNSGEDGGAEGITLGFRCGLNSPTGVGVGFFLSRFMASDSAVDDRTSLGIAFVARM